MNAKQLNFAYRVRQALNENLEELPASTTQALASARKMALSAKKSDNRTEPLAAQERVGGLSTVLSVRPLPFIVRLGYAAPAIALVAGLATIFHIEQQRRITDIAELDALVLSDELPVTAYLDHGFNAYLARQGK